MTYKSIDELEQASRENMEYIIDAIKAKLNVVNTAAISSKSFDTDQYEDLLDLYQFLSRRDHFTMSEIESIIAELGKMRKK